MKNSENSIDYSLIDYESSLEFKDLKVAVLKDGTVVGTDRLNPELISAKSKVGGKRIVVVDETTMNEIKERIDRYFVEKMKTDEDYEAEIGEETDSPAEEIDNSKIYAIVKADIFTSAVRKNASDIHIYPDFDIDEGTGERKKITFVKFRIDGRLVLHEKFPYRYSEYIINKLKIMGKMDVSTKHIPQDGKIVQVIEGERIEFRVSTMATAIGESCVLRLQRESSSQGSLEDVGFAKEDLEKYRESFYVPYGMILNVGTTGQGKTTTFYLTMEEMVEKFGGNRKIVTVEDPIERVIPGVVQHPVNEKKGATYPNILKALLRQDPDVILIGEIRDPETAKIAVQAALTGHLVLSTLHAGDVIAAIPRLEGMGVEKDVSGYVLNALISQRLIGKICPKCKTKKNVPSSTIEKYGFDFDASYYGTGCEYCDYTGIKGRTAVAEILTMDEEVKKAITEGYPEDALKKLLKKTGFKNMWSRGIEKVKNGTITLEDLLATVKPDSILNGNENSISRREIKVRKIIYPEIKVEVHAMGEFIGYLFDVSEEGLSILVEKGAPFTLKDDVTVTLKYGELEEKIEFISMAYAVYGEDGKSYVVGGRFVGESAIVKKLSGNE